jgi:hypothetical protein
MSTSTPPLRGLPPIVLGGIVIATLTAVAVWFTNYQGGTTTPGNLVEQARDIATDAAIDPKKARDDALAYQAKAAIAVVDNEKTLDLADTTLRTLDQAAAEAKAWADEVEPLLTNELGRRVAADAARLGAFRRAYAMERPAPSVLAPTRRGVEVLRGQVEAVLKHRDTAYTATEERAKLTEALRTAEQFVDAYRVPREQIASLVRQANQAEQTADATLSATLQAQADVEAGAALAAETRRQAEAAEEAERKKDELAAEARARADREAQADADRQALWAEAVEPATLDKFQPFLAEGYCNGQRMHNPNFREDYCFKPRRLFTAHELQALGVLDNFNTFLNVATAQNYFANDRPRWPVPETSADVAARQRDFENFKRFFPVWAKRGVLPP